MTPGKRVAGSKNVKQKSKLSKPIIRKSSLPLDRVAMLVEEANEISQLLNKDYVREFFEIIFVLFKMID